MTSTLPPWGVSATIDLYDCRRELLQSGEYLSRFMAELIQLIKMDAHGPCYVDRFGDGNLEGWSAMQFIKTSTITVHLDEVGDRAFIDIFSCKHFEVTEAEQFASRFFEAQSSSTSQRDR